MKKIVSIVGARPQFIKHAPMQLQLQKRFHAITVHTGQHYDYNMSDLFFNQLKIPRPDYLFEVDPGKETGEQIRDMMMEIENTCSRELPDVMLVYGDTNSTLAGALVAEKLNIPLVHIEAGLRSFNKEMPEENNRIITDKISTFLFCPTDKAVENLVNEGIDQDKIFLCGDVMCDILNLMTPKLKRLANHSYYFATIHRPYNTDNSERLKQIMTTFNGLNRKVIFAIHPRTISKMKDYDIHRSYYANIHFISPVGYLESLSYQKYADCVLTDSGGMQKEAYMLKRKCVTLRSETEWIETLSNGWNKLVFNDLDCLQQVINDVAGKYVPNLYGDGEASRRITELIEKNL